MNIPIEDLVKILDGLPIPHKQGQQIFVPIMEIPKITNSTTPPIPTKNRENELHFVSKLFYERPFFRWTLEL